MAEHSHDHQHGDFEACRLPEPFQVLRMPQDLTDALEDFLEQNVPDYRDVDFVSIQLETTVAETEDQPERTRRFFLVDHDADGDGPTPINDPKETE